MAKIIERDEAAKLVRDGMTIMVGGFLGCGAAQGVIDAICASDVKDLTLIVNDTAYPDSGSGKLVAAKKVKKVIASHVGTNPEVGAQAASGELVVEFCPQGSLLERIRCGGAGLGGALTKTGMGTLVAEGKTTVVVDGEEWLLEKPLRADVAIIGGTIVDEAGNVWYKGTARNFNPVMATAADICICEADELVKPGKIEPENVVTPGIYVDYIVEGAK